MLVIYTRHCLLEEQHENFATAVRKWEILAAIKVKMSGSVKWSESEHEHVWHFLHKTRNEEVPGSFWKFHVVVVQTNGKEMYKKSVLHVQSCFFAN